MHFDHHSPPIDIQFFSSKIGAEKIFLEFITQYSFLRRFALLLMPIFPFPLFQCFPYQPPPLPIFYTPVSRVTDLVVELSRGETSVNNMDDELNKEIVDETRLAELRNEIKRSTIKVAELMNELSPALPLKSDLTNREQDAMKDNEPTDEQAKIAELECQLAKSMTQIIELNAELAQKTDNDAAITYLESSRTESMLQASGLKMELAEKSIEAAKLRNELNKISVNVVEIEEKIAMNSSDFTVLKLEFHERRDVNKEEVVLLEKTLSESKFKIAKFEDEVSKKNNKIFELSEKLSRHEERLLSRELNVSKVANMKAMLLEKENNLTEIRRNCGLSLLMLNACEEKAVEMEKNFTAHSADVKDLEIKLAARQSKATELQNELDECRRECLQHLEEKLKQSEKTERLKDEIMQNKAKVHELYKL